MRTVCQVESDRSITKRRQTVREAIAEYLQQTWPWRFARWFRMWLRLVNALVRGHPVFYNVKFYVSSEPVIIVADHTLVWGCVFDGGQVKIEASHVALVGTVHRGFKEV